MILSIGDQLKCNKKYCGNFTYNKNYQIFKVIDYNIFVYDDNNIIVSFSLTEKYKHFYKDTFNCIKQERLEKLDNLEL